jgi:hypothetical protein
MPMPDRVLATAGNFSDSTPPCLYCRAAQNGAPAEDGQAPEPAWLGHLYQCLRELTYPGGRLTGLSQQRVRRAGAPLRPRGPLRHPGGGTPFPRRWRATAADAPAHTPGICPQAAPAIFTPSAPAVVAGRR